MQENIIRPMGQGRSKSAVDCVEVSAQRPLNSHDNRGRCTIYLSAVVPVSLAAWTHGEVSGLCIFFGCWIAKDDVVNGYGRNV